MVIHWVTLDCITTLFFEWNPLTGCDIRQDIFLLTVRPTIQHLILRDNLFGDQIFHVKGFGFIKPDNGEADIFVHISAVQASGLNGLNQDDKVSFDTEADKRGKGPKAVNLAMAD